MTTANPGSASPRFDLKGRVAWVTGASKGLGRAAAEALLEEGARVAVSARSEDPLRSLIVELDAGQQALVLPGSVADSAWVEQSVDRIIETWGRCDVLVNMAGINPTVRPSESLTDREWNEILTINLSGTFYCCRAVGRAMIASGSGSIINVSSVHGSVGVPRMPAYAASKGGVEALTRALALEWAQKGVRVNCIAPGYFRTPLTERYLDGRHGPAVTSAIPMGRVGDAGELVGAVLFLASEESSYMTGSTVVVDGGWTAQ